MRLRRACENDGALDLTNVQGLFEGSNKDRLQLLRQYLNSGENLKKVDMHLEFMREVEQESEGVEMLLTIDGMRKEGVSECLGPLRFQFFLVCVCGGGPFCYVPDVVLVLQGQDQSAGGDHPASS